MNWIADLPTLDPGTGFIYEAGFTPIRFPIGSNQLSELTSASGWRETKRVEILKADKNELVFRFRLYVKICRGLDYLQLPLTYHRAPLGRWRNLVQSPQEWRLHRSLVRDTNPDALAVHRLETGQSSAGHAFHNRTPGQRIHRNRRLPQGIAQGIAEFALSLTQIRVHN